MKRKYEALKDMGDVKRKMVFEWDTSEGCYTTKALPWFLTPLIRKEEMQKRIKIKQFGGL